MLTRSDLRRYQERMVKHIQDHENCALWVDMGLGKTVSTLTAIKDLRESLDVNKTLIVAPLRVARKTWDDEIREWEHLNHLTTAHIIGNTPAKRLAGLRQEADIHLINRENVAWLRDQFVSGTGKRMRLKKRWPWDTIVLDESSSFKSQTSQRWQAVRSLRKLYDRCIQLTGTPAPKGYIDLWAQMNILDRGERLGRTEKAFKDRWMLAPSRYDPDSVWEYRPGAKEQIHKAVSDIVIAMDAEDYLDLPDIMVNPVPVQLSPSEMGEYRRMEKQFAMELNGKRITAVNAGVCAGKLLQLANGAVYYDEGRYTAFHKRKLETLVELVDDINGPVMVAYGYRHDLERCIDTLRKKFRGKEIRILESEQDEDDWNNDKIDILLLHPASAGHGLNLHKGSGETIIWFGLTWNLEYYLQLNARLAGGHRRIGKNVVLHHIIAENTIDERALATLGARDADQNALTAAVKDYVKEVTA